MVSKALWGITAEDIVKFQLPEVNDVNGMKDDLGDKQDLE